MNEENAISFLSGLGEEFCQTLHPIVGWDAVVPHDAYEGFYSTFNQEPNPQRLAALSESQLEQWCAYCGEYFECQDITIEHIRSVVAATPARWPPEIS